MLADVDLKDMNTLTTKTTGCVDCERMKSDLFGFKAGDSEGGVRRSTDVDIVPSIGINVAAAEEMVEAGLENLSLVGIAVETYVEKKIFEPAPDETVDTIKQVCEKLGCSVLVRCTQYFKREDVVY